MSNIIVEFIKDIPELFLLFFPFVVLGVIGICWIICYYDYRTTKESKFSFWKFAYYWWTDLIFNWKKGEGNE